jgi:nucleoside-diphosphate-sugar epimerase
MNKKMKIVVIGGSGLIGKKLVNNLRRQGHEVVAASPSSGVNTEVITDTHALYFGIEVNDRSLTPGAHPRLGPTRFEEWLKKSDSIV